MPGTKKALCVGANYAGTDAELHGAVNDALRWGEVLVGHCGFRQRSVVTMIDEYPSGEAVSDDDENYVRPTKENIMEALDWLVKDVSEGDVLLFTFSGHGCQIPDIGSARDDEVLEEAICPIDWDQFDWGVVPFRVITYETLHRYFAMVPGGALLTVVLDAAVTGGPLQVPLRVDMEFPEREGDNLSTTHGEYRDYRFNCDTWLQNQHVSALPRRLPCEPRRPLWTRLLHLFTRETVPPLHEGLSAFCFTACRGPQTALDASLEGLQQGCLSFCLQKALDQLGFRCTYLELAEAMNYVASGLRHDVMPYMDQFFQLSYGHNAAADECLFLDPSAAFVAKDKARRRRGQKTRGGRFR